jgi:hypothetical protein
LTFFLGKAAEAPKIAANNPQVDIPSWADGVSAAFTTSSLENDANFRLQRETVSAKAERGWEIANRLGADAVMERAREAGFPEQSLTSFPDMVSRRPSNMPPEMERLLTEMAGEAAAQNPEGWADLDISDDALEKSVNARLQAEHQDAQQILEMMPSGRGSAGLTGAMAGITMDVKNIPFLVMGYGGGSIMRVMGREAAINMAAEAAFLPSQFKMAERLDIPDPSVVTQLAMAAAAGGVLGGAVEGASRGYVYFRGRNAVTPFAGRDEFDTQVLVDQAEDILASNTPAPVERIAELAEDAAPPPAAIVRPSERVFSQEGARPWEQPGDPGAQVDIPTDQSDPIEQALNEAITDARERDDKRAKPLIDFLSNGHRAPKGSTDPDGPSLQIDPDGPAGQELANMGITRKTAPRLFKKGGRTDLDNLVASEMEDLFPGIIDATNSRDPSLNGYLDPQGLIDVIARSAEGDSQWLRTRADVLELEDDLSRYIESRDNRPPDIEPVPDDLPPEQTAIEMQRVTRALDDEIDRLQARAFISEQQREDMIQYISRNGGSAEDMIYDMRDADLDFVEVDLESDDGRPFAQYIADDFERTAPTSEDAISAGNGGAGRAEQAPGANSGGATRAGSDQSASERTDAGEQTLIDGVTPITDRDRLQAAQNAPMRGGSAAADGGLFDLGSRNQSDMFSDPTSPEARVIQDTIADDIRTTIETDGEMMLDMGDGRGKRPVTSVLDELDDMDEFTEIMAMCGRPKA